MPRTWIYFMALFTLLAAAILIVDTRLILDQLWYRGYEAPYYMLNDLSAHPGLRDFIGGWPLPLFLGTVFCYWMTEYHDDDAIAAQFLVLPIAYAPFLIIGRALEAGQFEASMVATGLVAIPAGYLYVLPWAMFVWTFSKLRLVV